MHPDQAQNISSGIQGQEATAVAVIYVTAHTSMVRSCYFEEVLERKMKVKYLIFRRANDATIWLKILELAHWFPIEKVLNHCSIEALSNLEDISLHLPSCETPLQLSCKRFTLDFLALV